MTAHIAVDALGSPDYKARQLLGGTGAAAFVWAERPGIHPAPPLQCHED